MNKILYIDDHNRIPLQMEPVELKQVAPVVDKKIQMDTLVELFKSMSREEFFALLVDKKEPQLTPEQVEANLKKELERKVDEVIETKCNRDATFTTGSVRVHSISPDGVDNYNTLRNGKTTAGATRPFFAKICSATIFVVPCSEILEENLLVALRKRTIEQAEQTANNGNYAPYYFALPTGTKFYMSGIVVSSSEETLVQFEKGTTISNIQSCVGYFDDGQALRDLSGLTLTL